jgi:hypothetical protein
MMSHPPSPRLRRQAAAIATAWQIAQRDRSPIENRIVCFARCVGRRDIAHTIESIRSRRRSTIGVRDFRFASRQRSDIRNRLLNATKGECRLTAPTSDRGEAPKKRRRVSAA